jgi:hypothetical protein
LSHSKNLKFASFGYFCRTGFQIRRLFGKDRCFPTIFDRQVTPPEAICAYLDNNFRGMFERADVVPVGDYLYNMRYGIRYAHEVENAFWRYGYEDAAAVHGRLCDLTRQAFTSREPIAAVICPRKPYKGPDDVVRGLERHFPALAERVVIIDDDGEGSSTQALWRGNNELWDAAFRDYNPLPEPSPVRRQIERLRRHIARLRNPDLKHIPE